MAPSHWNVCAAILTAAAALSPGTAHAKDVCDYLNTYCDKLNPSGRLPELGGALASFADAFNLNPASIPTKPTPIGIEVITTPSTTTVGGTNYNVALIRGFQRFGMGLSTNSDNTFYSNKTWASPTAYANTVSLPSVTNLATPTLNVAGSFSLVEDRDHAFITPNVGVSARYNRISNQLGGGLGIGFVTQYVSLGLAANRDQSNSGSGQVNFFDASLGVRLGFLQMDYNFIQNSDTSYAGGISVFTVTGSLGAFLLTAAERSFADSAGFTYAQLHLALQWQVSSRISLGYLLNYVPGSSSLGAQVFLF